MFFATVLFILAIVSSIQAQNAHYNRSLEAIDYWKSLQNKFTPDLVKGILKNNTNYAKSFPFPHMYFDGLFPMDILLAAEKEIPDQPNLQNGCVKGAGACFKGKNQLYKNAFDNENSMGPATSTLFAFLKSSNFLKFLEKLTGIENLVPDPHFRGSGVHQTLTGGYLAVHADFNRYEKYDMHRRVNAFIFLNPNWDDSFGGHLELWSKNLQSCGAKIAPVLGRFVVFSSTDFSYHGHPHPLTTPKERSRRSLALYYYTRSRPSNECLKNDCKYAHSTLFQTPLCSSCDDQACKAYK